MSIILVDNRGKKEENKKKNEIKVDRTELNRIGSNMQPMTHLLGHLQRKTKNAYKY